MSEDDLFQRGRENIIKIFSTSQRNYFKGIYQEKDNQQEEEKELKRLYGKISGHL